MYVWLFCAGKFADVIINISCMCLSMILVCVAVEIDFYGLGTPWAVAVSFAELKREGEKTTRNKTHSLAPPLLFAATL